MIQGAKNTAFFIEKPYKLTLTGLCKQKQGSYNGRYITGARFVACPNGNIIRRPPVCPDKDIEKTRISKDMPELDFENEGPVKARDYQWKPKPTYRLNKKKLRTRILVYADMMRRSVAWKKKELYFWTITFPKGTSDDLCYQLLNIWLTQLRQKKLLHSYLWVAERQQNGTIHFHVLIPHFMKIGVANKTMMISICSMVRKKKLGWNLAAAKRYNGVDIDKDRRNRKVVNFAEKKRIRALYRYLVKYVTKNNTAMNRLCWNCSVDWSIPFSGMCFTRPELISFVDSPEYLNLETFENDYIIFWRWSRAGPPWIFVDHLAKVNIAIMRDYLREIGKEKIFLN